MGIENLKFIFLNTLHKQKNDPRVTSISISRVGNISDQISRTMICETDVYWHHWRTSKCKCRVNDVMFLDLRWFSISRKNINRPLSDPGQSVNVRQNVKSVMRPSVSKFSRLAHVNGGLKFLIRAGMVAGKWIDDLMTNLYYWKRRHTFAKFPYLWILTYSMFLEK